ncbi:MAG: type I methionyl aminopeptidase [Candidatus Latescibacteria bacterium]|nr:type I methionyl aminopeptidase [Candidatus Latescibacterota bacterium]
MYCKKPAELAQIHASCQVVYQVQQALEAAITPGVTTLELDHLAEQIIRARGGRPAFKGYHGFPGSICASVNEEVVHGFPNQRPLQAGDLLTVDVGVELEGFYGDGAFTCGVGALSGPAQHLLDTTRACLEAGIDPARAGGRLSDISHAVQCRAEAAGTAVVRQYGGHGIGRALHEDPHVSNYGPPGRGPRLQPGLVLAIEPILSLGAHQVEVDEDGWTTRTRDGALAAHCEHTVAITEAGPWVLTLPGDGPR